MKIENNFHTQVCACAPQTCYAHRTCARKGYNMSKKKNLFLVLSLIFCLFLGNSSIFAAVNKGGEVIHSEKVELSENTSFYAAENASTFQINPGIGVKTLKISGSNINLEKAIKDIEDGRIKPLSSSNVPEDILSNSKLDFTNVDGESTDIELKDTKTKANCSHAYTPGTFSAHGKYSDGSCQTTSYDALRCSKCGTIWLLDVIGTTTYRVCPH